MSRNYNGNGGLSLQRYSGESFYVIDKKTGEVIARTTVSEDTKQARLIIKAPRRYEIMRAELISPEKLSKFERSLQNGG